MLGTLKTKWIKAQDFRYGRGGNHVRTVLLHSSDGHKEGDIETLTGAGSPIVSAHFYVTRMGELYQFVKEKDTAYHAGRVDKWEHSNSCTVGIEQEHLDGDGGDPGQDWPDVQVRKTANLVAYLRQQYGATIPILSHAAVAVPKGRKQDPRGYPWPVFSLWVRGYSKVTWTLERSNEVTS